MQALECNHDNNEDIRDKYELGAILGSGSFGQVREATLKGVVNSEVRAVKVIERDSEDGEWSNQAIFVREVGLLQCIQHENIIRYYDFYEDVHFLYVVMELCKGGEVFAKIVEQKRFSEKNSASLGMQMLKAIQYIHHMKIMHRDIKAENFMLAEPAINSQVKMIDFGMACKFEEGQVLTELCGSPHYLAPELIGQKYDRRADVWAFGVLLYLLQYGHYPYDAKHPRDIMVKILTEPIRWQTKVKLSRHGLDFLTKLLEHEPKKRMSAEQALEHQWMSLVTSTCTKNEGEVIDVEVLRSAHKKVTATRKIVDAKVDEQRNQKLKMIDEDFAKGIRHGQRLGETPKEEYMSKPEFVRRENKITTAPSRDLNTRRNSMKKLLSGLSGSGSKGNKHPGGLSGISETTAGQTSAAEGFKKPTRSFSVSAAPKRRLSYIGALTGTEEKHLANLYEDKQLNAVVPVDAPPSKDSAGEGGGD
uniref:Protein kinase domain-containing protein n=1 Tax=Zooxanthella nutricula TaxID=1333877 RepID=A0A6U6NYS6_9DINO